MAPDFSASTACPAPGAAGTASATPRRSAGRPRCPARPRGPAHGPKQRNQTDKKEPYQTNKQNKETKQTPKEPNQTNKPNEKANKHQRNKTKATKSQKSQKQKGSLISFTSSASVKGFTPSSAARRLSTRRALGLSKTPAELWSALTKKTCAL